MGLMLAMGVSLFGHWLPVGFLWMVVFLSRYKKIPCEGEKISMEELGAPKFMNSMTTKSGKKERIFKMMTTKTPSKKS